MLLNIEIYGGIFREHYVCRVDHIYCQLSKRMKCNTMNMMRRRACGSVLTTEREMIRFTVRNASNCMLTTKLENSDTMWM